MGWDGCYDWKKKADAKMAAIRDLGGVEAAKMAGGALYCVKNGAIFVVIFEAAKHEGERYWNYKVMDETMYPYYFDCPETVLKAAGEPPTEKAAEWREHCRTHQATIARRKELYDIIEVGDVVTLAEGYKPNELKVVEVGKKVLARAATGRLYAVPKKAVVAVQAG